MAALPASAGGCAGRRRGGGGLSRGRERGGPAIPLPGFEEMTGCRVEHAGHLSTVGPGHERMRPATGEAGRIEVSRYRVGGGRGVPRRTAREARAPAGARPRDCRGARAGFRLARVRIRGGVERSGPWSYTKGVERGRTGWEASSASVVSSRTPGPGSVSRREDSACIATRAAIRPSADAGCAPARAPSAPASSKGDDRRLTQRRSLSGSVPDVSLSRGETAPTLPPVRRPSPFAWRSR